MPTRAELQALPIGQLRTLANAAMRATSERYGWPPRRSVGLPVQLLVEIVMQGERRATERKLQKVVASIHSNG